MTKIYSLFTLAICISPLFANEEPTAVDLASIAGKTQNEVSKVLGSPIDNEMTRENGSTKYGPKKFYRDESVEIVFIDGKADWITIYPKEKVHFSVEALTALGLEVRGSDFRNDNEIRWGKHVKYHEISAFGGQNDSVWYYYIKVKTE